MNDRAYRIKKAIEDSGYSYPELEKITGISKSSLQRYATGETKKIPIDCIEKIAQATGVTSAYIMGWDNSLPSSTTPHFDNIFPITRKRLPLLGEIACGEPIFASEDRESYVDAGTEIQADFCLKAKGDSMIGARIYDGDIVFIRKQPSVENGDIAAVVIENEATLKRVNYFPEKNMLILKAENPQFKDLIYMDAELEQIHILGKAVAFQSDVR